MSILSTNPLAETAYVRCDLFVEQSDSTGKTLGEAVRERRESLGISQEDLARELDLTVKSIHNLETGETSKLQKLDHMKALATWMELDVVALMKMSRVGDEVGKTVRVPIPTKLMEGIASRVGEGSAGKWVTKAIEAILEVQDWKPGDKLKAAK
jgi:transcriptional regulator with XRE-family HTH domain